MRFSFLLAMLFSLSAFAEPPEIVTAPKGVKTIYRDQLTGYGGKQGEFSRWYTEISGFDENGRLVSMVTKYPDDDSWCQPVHEDFTYQLDGQGRVLEMTHVWNGTRREVWRYAYRGDGAYEVETFPCDANGDIEDDRFPYETWSFDDKGKILSMKAYDQCGARTKKYEYAAWNGKLLSIVEESYKWEKKNEITRYEDLRLYDNDDKLEILYNYDSFGAIYSKAEYDKNEVPVKMTIFGNEMKRVLKIRRVPGALTEEEKSSAWRFTIRGLFIEISISLPTENVLVWCAPICRYEYEQPMVELHGIKLKDYELEAVYDIKYPHKSDTDWSSDYSQDGTETLSVIRKNVYRYEFTDAWLKKEKEDKEGK